MIVVAPYMLFEIINFDIDEARNFLIELSCHVWAFCHVIIFILLDPVGTIVKSG